MDVDKDRVSRRMFRAGGSLALAVALASGYLSPAALAQDASTDMPYAGTTLTVATLDGELSAGVEAQMAALEEATGIKLEVSKMPQTEFRQKIAADLASGSGVYDIIIEPYVFLHDHIAAEQILPLDEYIAADPEFHAEDFIQSIYTTYGTWTDGKQYTIPYKPDTHLFYYRKDLIEDPDLQAAFKAQTGHDLKPPTTWDEQIEVARFFTKSINPEFPTDYGFVFWGDPIGSFWLWGVILGSLGGDYFDADGNPTLDTPEGQKAMEIAQALLETAPEDVGSYEWDKLNTAFISGKAATAINWPGLGILSETAETATGKSEVVGKVGYSVPPGSIVDGELNQVSLMGGWTSGISKYSDDPDAAFAALAFMTGPDGEPLKVAAGDAPARTSTYPKLDASGTNAFLPTMLEAIGAAKINADIDRPPVSAELQNVLQVDTNQVWTGQMSAADALADMQAQFVSILGDVGLLP